jgi:hypothetical protein
MKKLIICGDSFMSPAIDYPNTHFSEIIADKLGYELISYSRAGMSNGGVAIQIDTAIQQKPDLILVGTTYSDRIEFPINDPKPTEKFTIDDISYHHTPTSSSYNISLNPQLISTNIVEVISNKFANTFKLCEQPHKKEKAIKDWFRYLYHPDWKNQVDQWMMYAVLHKLHESTIPYIVFRDPLNVVPKCSWLKCTALVWHINKMMDDRKQVDAGGPNLPYHTSVETQAIVAECLLAYIKEHIDV